MDEEIARTIAKLEEMKWITINPHLNRDTLVAAFLDTFKEMPLKRAIEIFFPKGLF